MGTNSIELTWGMETRASPNHRVTQSENFRSGFDGCVAHTCVNGSVAEVINMDRGEPETQITQ